MAVKNLLETLVSEIVDDPDVITVKEMRGRDGMEYSIRVAPPDVGKIIGKRGRVATAIRTVVDAVAQKERQTVSVKFETE
jgi:predicted RNA-binding protein YlqC (UPF0109 family)